jgi:hypothetical protein
MSEPDIVIRALSVTIVSNLDAAKLTNELDMFLFSVFFFGFKELESEEGCWRGLGFRAHNLLQPRQGPFDSQP